MKHLLQTTKRRLLWFFALVFALGISTQVQAQTITEGFEETQWTAVTATANGSATISSYVDGTNATAHTGIWRINSACTVSTISSNTASSRTWTVHGGARAVALQSGTGAYIMTPLFPNGVTSVKYWVRTHSSTAVPAVFMATNTTITSNTGSLSTQATGAWYGSMASTIHSSLGWTSVSFSITGAASTAPCYLKFARTSSSMVIDDIEITTPESCTTPTQKTVTGTTTICSGSSTNITVESSQSGVTYDLYVGGVAQNDTKSGNGSNLSWSVSPSATTTYAIYSTTAGGYCSTQMGSTQTVTVTQAPTTAAAGSDQNKTEGQVATLAANNPSVGTGAWTVVSGPSTSSSQFGNTAVYNTTFTPAGGNGDYVLRWTISNSPCTASTDEVTISYEAAANPTLTLTSATGTDAQSLPATVSITNIVYTWGGTATTAGVTWTGTASSSTPPTGLSVNLDNGAKTLTISGTPSVAGNYGYTVSTDGGTPAEKTGTITVNTPSISVTTTVMDLSTTGWAASSSTSRAVSGSNLVSNISVSVDVPFQVSNDNSTWGTTTSFTKSGYSASGTLYVRYNPSSGDGTDSGTITISATGASSRNIDVTGTAAAKITLSSGSATQSVKQNVAITNIVYTVEGGVTGASCTGLPTGVTFDDETYTISGTPTTSTYQAYPYTVTIEGPEGTTDATANGTITVKDPNAITVAYLYGTGLAIGSDDLYAYLDTKFAVTAIDATTIGTSKSEVETALADYDVVFQAESTVGGSANTNALEGISKPFVNAKHFTYTSGRWTWGTPNNGASAIKDITVDETHKTHPIFNGLTFTGDSINVLGVSANAKGVGYVSSMTFEGTVTLGYSQKRSSFIAIQEVPVGTTYETGKTTTHKYVMIAINALSYAALTTDGYKLYENAIKYVIAPECTLAAPTGVTSDSPQCAATGVTLSSEDEATEGETWYWQTSATGTSTSHSTPYNTTTSGTYYLRSYDGNCWSPASSGVSVTINTAPSISAHPATGGQNLCKDASATALSVTASGTGLSYQWYSSDDAATNTSSDDATVGTDSNSHSPSTATAGTKYYYCVVSGTCSPAATSNVSGAIVVSATSVGGTAAAVASSVCTGSGTTINLSGQTGTIQWQTNASGSWANIDGETTASYATPNLTTTTSYRAVVTNGYCSGANSSTAEVTVNAVPTTSAAGSDQSKVDGLSFTLAANEPSVGTGAWSIVSGSPSSNTSQFSSLTAYNATFTPDGGPGDYTLRWTISNTPCTASTDDVVLTVTSAGAPSLEHTSGLTSQTVSAGTAISGIVYTWAGTATTAAVTWTGSSTSLPTGLSVDLDNDNKTLTISGTPTVAGTYNFSVKSNDGSSNYSDALTGTITVKLATPSVAAGATTATNQGFTAQWSNVSGESSYTVKVYLSGELVKTVSSIDANETSTVITGLNANTTYTYKVTAIGNGDDVLNSNESSASSGVRTLNTAKAITAFTIADVSATITEGTHTIAATVPAGTDITSLTPSVTVSSYADYSPKTAQNFTTDKMYTVTAEDGSTQEYTVTIALTLSTPTVSDATTRTNQGFTANWSAVSNASSYTITVYQGESVATTITGETGTNVAVSGLSNNTTYTYKVQAIGNGTKYLNSAQSSASNSVRTLSTACSITSFTISGQIGDTTIDGTAISITMPTGTNRSSLTPTISVSANASVNPTSGSAQNFTSPVEYTVTAEDGTTQTVYTVTVTNSAGSSACDITGFTFTNQVGSTVIDGTNISVTMPAGTMRYGLTPASITLSDYATVSPLASAAQDFRSPVVYTVTAQNGSTQKQYTVTVTNEEAPPSTLTWLTSSATYNGTSTGYEVANVGTYYKGTSGGTATVNTGLTACHGSTSTIVMGSSLFIFKALADITSITIYGNSGTGSSRTLSSVATSSTLGGTYTALSPSASASGNLSGSQATNVCSPSPMTITFNSTITAGTFFRVTLSGNAYIAAIDLATTSGSSTTQLTAPTVGSASDRTNQGFTANWSDVSNEIGYTVKVYQGASLVKTIEDIAANATSVEVSGLDANTSYTYKVTAIGEGDVYTDSAESSASASVRTKNTAKDITAFTIAGVSATIDGLAISAQVPYSTNLTSLTPSVTVSAYAEYAPSGAQDFSSGVEYTVTAEDGSQKVYTVSLTKAEASAACDITDISITGQISSDIDEENKTIAIVMPYGTTVTSLTPTITTSLAATYVPQGAQNFTNPVQYTITAEDGETEQVYTVAVTIATPTINACAGPFNFTTTGWSASDAQYFTLTGSNLVANISVAVDAPFQVSNNNTTWDTTTSLTKSGFTASGNIYIRYNPTSSSTGEDSGTVIFSTTGADNSVIALEGVAAPAINNPGNKNQAVKQNVAIADIVFTVTGGVTEATCTGLPAGVTFNDVTYTISGTPTTSTYQAYPYTVTIKGPSGTTDATQTGTITVKDPNAITVAYLYGTGLAIGSDQLYAHLSTIFEVTAIDATTIGTSKSAIETFLAAYDVVFQAESTVGGSANTNALEGISKPFVNAKNFTYTDGRWTWGTPNNGATAIKEVTVVDKLHPLFNGLTFTANNVTLLGATANAKGVGYVESMTFTGHITLAYSESNTGRIAIQEVPVGTTYETGKQTTHKYVMIAINALSYAALTTDGYKLYENAIKYVAAPQAVTDTFRSTADGTWTSTSAWESTTNGTNYNSGSVVPTASSAKVIIANNITVPTTSSVQAPAILTIEPTGKLTVADDGQDYATFTIPTGGKLILESNDTVTAQVKNDGEVVNNGSIVIRKTLTASKGWYFVSFPFDVDSTRVLIAGTETSATWGGPVDNGYNFYVAEYDAERRDTEGAPNYTGTGNYWKGVSPKVLVKNRGYIIGADADITLDFVSGVSPTTTMFSTTAEEDLVSYATNSANIHHSWNLMGIPFGSAFNFNNVSPDQAPFYFHDGTQYVTIMGDNYEAYPYTSFFLQRNPGATVPAKLSFASAGRTLKSLAVNRFDEVGLVVKNAKYSDKVRIRLQEDASAGYEIGKDAVKFFATKAEVPQIYSKQGNYVLSVNSVPVTTAEVSVTVKAGEEGNYTIAMENIAKAAGCKQVILKDGNAETDLLIENEYTFSAAAGASKNFTVLFVTDNTTTVTTTEGSAIVIKTIGDKAYINGLEGVAEVSIYDVSGKLVQRFANVNNNDALTLKQVGIYVVDVKTATQQGKAKVSVTK